MSERKSKGQGALEYMTLIVAVLIIAAIAVYLSSSSAGPQIDTAMLAACKQAAGTCKMLLASNPNDPCIICEQQCIDSRSGKDILSGTPGCGAACKMCKEGDTAMISGPIAAFDVPCCTYGKVCTFDGSASSDPSGLPIVDYTWHILNKQLTGKTVQYVADMLVGGFVNLTVTNSQGGVASVEKTIVINTPPTPQITVLSPLDCAGSVAPVLPAPDPMKTYKAYCLSAGTDVDIDSTLTYAWDCGNGQTGSADKVICSYECLLSVCSTFQKTVSLTVTEVDSCGETATDTITCSESGCADAAHCLNSVKDNDETDVDCGGASCVKCADGKGCSASSDCSSNYCNVQGKCAASSCASNSAPTATITTSSGCAIPIDPTKSFSCFTAATSSDPDGDTLTYAWDCGNGQTGTAALMLCSYTKPMGPLPTTYTATLTVSDPCYHSDSDTESVCVGSGC